MLKNLKSFNVTITGANWYGQVFWSNYTRPADYTRAIMAVLKNSSDNSNYQIIPSYNSIYLYKIDANRMIIRCTPQDTISLDVTVYYI